MKVLQLQMNSQHGQQPQGAKVLEKEGKDLPPDAGKD